MKALVTGAAGFIGSHLVDALIEEYDVVYGVDNLVGGYESNVNPSSQFTPIDLCDKQAVSDYIKKIKPDVLFHLAADATEGRSQFTPISASENNYLAYLYTLIPCIQQHIKKVVLVSSMSVYGSQKPPFSEEMPKKPDDVYGVTKAAMEDVTQVLAKVHGFEYSIIRPHNVYGPRQNMRDPYRNVVAIFINRLLQNKPFYIYGKGNQKRAFTYIQDLIPYMVTIGSSESCNGEIFNIGPDQEYTINQLSEAILTTWFQNTTIPESLTPHYLPLRPLEVVNAYCTNDKAKKHLGYTTSVSLLKGIQETVAWAKSVGPQPFQYIDLELMNDDVPETWKKHLI